METSPNRWSTKLRDAIVSNSAIRDGLKDDEAQPLIDWGLSLADSIGAKMENVPESEIEEVYDKYQAALSKLLTRINWLITFSQKKGPAWTQKTIDQLNELTHTLFGEQAPQLPVEDIMNYVLSDSDAADRRARVQQLMQRVAPKPKTTLEEDCL